MEHELTHYFQWVNSLNLTPIGQERQATKYARYIMDEYAATREHASYQYNTWGNPISMTDTSGTGNENENPVNLIDDDGHLPKWGKLSWKNNGNLKRRYLMSSISL